ncbi:MAG: bifunctional uridylyltransferase/uridylyl-removing protein, partial [Betaproteobacteria bacterium]|nr:bifunctional uridylyltransferase/uridylyl-removing protein [Betaproteobacteria bacterium]
MTLNRDRWHVERTRLIASYHPRQDPRGLLKRLAEHADRALIQLWCEAKLPPEASLVAVGGYGRGELYPGSDLDLLILIDEALEASARPALEAFVCACWNLGLDIGHAVRSHEHCLHEAATELTVQTALLEVRLLAGEASQLQ